MRKHFDFFRFVFSVILLASGTVGYGQVEIPDPNLRKAIETALDKEAGEAITKAEMETLTRLEAHEREVSDLTGIEHAVGLKELFLYSNQISDISALSGLTNLIQLALTNNPISDMSVLARLTKLQLLWLNNIPILDMSVLAGLIDLRELQIENTSISDISDLSGLTNLTTLYVGNNQISDISALSNLTNLWELHLHDNEISDISALSGLTNLQRLSLDRNPISDVSSLSRLVNLEGLSFSRTEVTDLSPLSKMLRLKELWIQHTLVSDISPLSGLTNLSRLEIWDIPISDISVLSNLSNLTWLKLESVKISDISALSDLTKLTVLWLHSTLVSDISPVSNLTELVELNLNHTLVSDLSPVSNLTNLDILHSNYIPISNVFPVMSTGLGPGDEVGFVGTVLDYPSIYEYIPALRERGVTVYFHDHQKRVPTTLDKVSDDPLVVVVRDESRRTFEGVPVNFAIIEGKGVIKETVATDNNGRAQAIFQCNSSTGFNAISASVDGIEETLTFDVVNELGFELALPLGVSFIHVPLAITEIDGAANTIETIGDLYDVLGGEGVVNLLITYNTTTQRWSSYSGARDRNKPSDKVLTDELGIIASVNNPVSLRLRGVPLGVNGQSSIMLCPGLNLVGIPLNDSRITRVSDILQLEGIVGNSSTIIVYDDDGIKVVAQANDDGDIDIKGGQSFIVIAQESAQIDFEGGGWSNTIEDELRILEDLLSNK